MTGRGTGGLAALHRARGARPVREVAAAAGVAEETVRKIEQGAVPTPALFTVAAIAQVLDLGLDELVQEAGCAGLSLTSPDERYPRQPPT